jgi:hypothetical protein
VADVRTTAELLAGVWDVETLRQTWQLKHPSCLQVWLLKLVMKQEQEKVCERHAELARAPP